MSRHDNPDSMWWDDMSQEFRNSADWCSEHQSWPESCPGDPHNMNW